MNKEQFEELQKSLTLALEYARLRRGEHPGYHLDGQRWRSRADTLANASRVIEAIRAELFGVPK